MKRYISLFFLIALGLSCSRFPQEGPVRTQSCPSGRSVNIIGTYLSFGHYSGTSSGKDDSIDIQIVANQDPKLQDEEVLDAFNLVKPICESWGILNAQVSVYKSTDTHSDFVAYQYKRSDGGAWRSEKLSGVYRP